MGLIMLKKLKIVSIILLALSLLFLLNTTVFATDINMNLPVEEENLVSEDGNLIDGDEPATEDPNAIENIQDDLQYSTDGVQDATDTTLTPQDDIGGDATPSSVSSIAQENMSFSNILNILIITVGVILILLAIAILVRLKS